MIRSCSLGVVMLPLVVGVGRAENACDANVHRTRVVKQVVVQAIAVPHSYPSLYAYDVQVPSFGDRAAFHASQLEKIRTQVALDLQQVLAAEQHPTSLFGLRFERESPAPGDLLRGAGFQQCAACHAPQNAALGGGVGFSSFAELNAHQRGQAARLVLGGEMPKGAKLDDDARNALANSILTGKE